MKKLLFTLGLLITPHLVFADGSAPQGAPIKWKVKNDSTFVIINLNGSADTLIAITDSLGVTYFKAIDNSAFTFLDLINILDFSLYVGGATIAVYDTSDVPVDGDVLTFTAVGTKLDWQPDAGAGGGTIDSSIIDEGGGVYKSSSVKAWSMKAGTGISYTTLTDSAGIDTFTISSSGGSARWLDVGTADTSSLFGVSDTLIVAADTSFYTSFETSNDSGFLYLDPLVIDGTKDAVQFRVQAVAGQTQEIIRIELSDGTEVLSIHEDGFAHFTHTAEIDDEFSMLIENDAAGFGGVKAISIDFTTGNTAATERGVGVLVNFNEAAATGGNFMGLEVLTTTVGGATTHGLQAGIGVAPIRQESGVFGNIGFGEKRGSGAYVDIVTAASSTVTDVALWEADNDSVFIGNATTFESIECIWEIVATKDMKFVISYSSGAGAWTLFSPTDGTNGAVNNGVIAWQVTDLAGWSSEAVDGDAAFWVVIVRTKNIATGPTEDLIQSATAIQYVWNSTGDITANSFRFEGVTEDAFEQIFTTTDPTADRTIDFPDDEIVAGDVLVGDGVTSLAYLNLTTTQILIGDGVGIPTAAALSGDATMTNAGVVTVVDDLHNHTSTSISGIDTVTTTINHTQWDEHIKDNVGDMVTGNTETGITVTYQDADNTLDFVVTAAGVFEEADGTDDTARWITPAGDTGIVFVSDEVGNSLITVGLEGDATATTLRIKVDTLDINTDVIMDFTGTNLSVTAGVLNAAGGSGAFDDIDGGEDTARYVAPNGDTALVVSSDNVGNTRITVGQEGDGTATTLSLVVDTILLNNVAVIDLEGTNLSITAGVLNATSGARWLDKGNADTVTLAGAADTLMRISDSINHTTIQTQNSSGFMFLDDIHGGGQDWISMQSITANGFVDVTSNINPLRMKVNSTSSNEAVITVDVNNNGAGDAVFHSTVQTTVFSMGVENLATNKFTFSNSIGLGTNNIFTIEDGTQVITFNDAYSFPTVDGTANQILKTDGAGVLTFQADATGSGPWATKNTSDSIFAIGSGTTSDTIAIFIRNVTTNASLLKGGNGDGSLKIELDTVVIGPDVLMDITTASIGLVAGALTVTDDGHNHVITNIDAFTETQLETQLSDVTALFTNNVTGDVTVSGATSTLGSNTVDSTKVIANSLSMSADLIAFTKAELEGRTSDVANFAEADGDVFTGIHDFGGATTFELWNATNPATAIIGQLAIDVDDTSIELFDGVRSVQMPMHYSKSILVFNPDLITDTVPLWAADSAMMQGGFTLVHANITTSIDGAYTLEFFEFTSADPPVRVGGGAIGGLIVGAADQISDTTIFSDATIAVGNKLYMLTPSTNIEWINFEIRYFIIGND